MYLYKLCKMYSLLFKSSFPWQPFLSLQLTYMVPIADWTVAGEGRRVVWQTYKSTPEMGEVRIPASFSVFIYSKPKRKTSQHHQVTQKKRKHAQNQKRMRKRPPTKNKSKSYTTATSWRGGGGEWSHPHGWWVHTHTHTHNRRGWLALEVKGVCLRHIRTDTHTNWANR